MQVRFYVDTFDVRMRGAGGDAQFLGNFSLRQAHCIEREDLGLSVREQKLVLHLFCVVLHKSAADAGGIFFDRVVKAKQGSDAFCGGRAFFVGNRAFGPDDLHENQLGVCRNRKAACLPWSPVLFP